MAESLDPQTASRAATASPVNSIADIGTYVFCGFSLLSLIVFFGHGLVPIDFGEAVLWGLIAWFWHKRQPHSQASAVGLMLLAIAVAAGEGYLIGVRSGRRAGRPTYSTFSPGFVIDSTPKPAAENIWNEAQKISEAEKVASQPTVVSPKAEKAKTVKRQAQLARDTPSNPEPNSEPSSSCSEPLGPNEARTPVALSPSEVSLVKLSLDATETDDMRLEIDNESGYCITSITVAVVIESDWQKIDRSVDDSLPFSPAIGPGQKMRKGVGNYIYSPGGGSERVSGLVKQWKVTEVRGYPVPPKKQ